MFLYPQVTLWPFLIHFLWSLGLLLMSLFFSCFFSSFLLSHIRKAQFVLNHHTTYLYFSFATSFGKSVILHSVNSTVICSHP